MAIDQEIKKKIAQDWKAAFPGLELYTQNKLYKIVGPIIIGLELIKLPRTLEYRPHFVIYPLWLRDIGTSLCFPVLLKEFYNNKNLQYSIPYELHDIFFNDAVNSIAEQMPLNFTGDIALGELLIALDKFAKDRPLNVAPNSYWQAMLQEAKLKVSLYVGIEEAELVLAHIKKCNWDNSHFKVCGTEVSLWIQSLAKTISDREIFLAQIMANKQDCKIAKLNSSELTM